MPRATETQILNSLAAGNVVPPALLNKLLAKVAKDQSKKKGRAATAQTEQDFIGIYNGLTAPEQQTLRTGIVNYVSDSAGINGYLRTGAPATAAAAAASVDAVFVIYAHYNFDQVRRICYRLQTYGPGVAVPYATAVPAGLPPPPHIVVNDLIRDVAFWSTSENRQFVANGVPGAAAGTRYVKFVIIGTSGINIAAHYAPGMGWGPVPSYSNANEAALDAAKRPGESDVAWKMRLAFKSRPAGQAEILFNRGLIYRVDAIQAVGTDFHVRLSVPNPQPGLAGVKNAYTGV
ncbi:MAG TPA: hypothetical protein VF283_08840 [Bryobacteraceae bacterium]